jgi:hypothetical protein
MPICILCLVIRNSFVKATWVAFASECVMEVVGGIIWSTNSSLFPSDDVFMFMPLCNIETFDGSSELNLSRGRYLWLKRLYKIWTVVPPKSLQYEQKSTVLKKKHFEVTAKWYKRHSLLPFFFLYLIHCKRGNECTCYIKTHFSLLSKNECRLISVFNKSSHNNKNDIDVSTVIRKLCQIWKRVN